MTRNSVVIGDVSRRILSQSTQLLCFAVSLAQIARTACCRFQQSHMNSAVTIIATNRYLEVEDRRLPRIY
jgi:hypothetical protein